MEVHHHPHIEKKNFKEYFFEFIMIFLAVTLGFIAENIREHFADKKKEQKYIQSLYYDLKDDTTSLDENIPFFQTQEKNIDTLRDEIKKGSDMNNVKANEKAATMREYDNFLYHDRTIAQLKNSGDFRLLNPALADSIMEYDSYITSQLRDQEAHGQKIYTDLNNLQNKIFEAGLLQIYIAHGAAYTDSLLRTNPDNFKIHVQDKELLFEYYNELEFWQMGILWRLYSYRYLREKAVNLINLIQKNYDIKNE